MTTVENIIATYNEEEEEEEELEFYVLSARYRIFKSLSSHMYRAYRGKKGETEFGYRETGNSTRATLLLTRDRYLTSPSDGRS